MRTIFLYKLLVVILYSAAITFAITALAAEDYSVIVTTDPGTSWNQSNWFTRSHPTPAQFSITNTGEMYGITTSGITFTQTNVPNRFGFRIQKFTMQNHYHYIVDGVPIYNLTELSVALTKHSNTKETYTG
jgi:hypothetical protein